MNNIHHLPRTPEAESIDDVLARATPRPVRRENPVGVVIIIAIIVITVVNKHAPEKLKYNCSNDYK